MNAPSEDERHLCLGCLAPNFPEAHFCKKCGAPMDSYAATAPFERTLAMGHAFRSATTGRPRLIMVAGVWALFLPMVVFGAIGVAEVTRGQGNAVAAAMTIAAGLFGVAIIFLTTRNYLRKLAPSEE